MTTTSLEPEKRKYRRVYVGKSSLNSKAFYVTLDELKGIFGNIGLAVRVHNGLVQMEVVTLDTAFFAGKAEVGIKEATIFTLDELKKMFGNVGLALRMHKRMVRLTVIEGLLDSFILKKAA